MPCPEAAEGVCSKREMRPHPSSLVANGLRKGRLWRVRLQAGRYRPANDMPVINTQSKAITAA